MGGFADSTFSLHLQPNHIVCFASNISISSHNCIEERSGGIADLLQTAIICARVAESLGFRFRHKVFLDDTPGFVHEELRVE